MAAFTTGLELILNACESVLQIGITDDEEALCFQQWHCPGRATEILAPALAAAFSSLGIEALSLRRIACVNGPGSFTGIRLVLASSAALGRAAGASLGALDYMQCLATTVAIQRGLQYGKLIYVITHARKNLVHFQPFIAYGPQIPAQPLREVEVVTPGSALAKMEKADAFLCGSALKLYPDLFAQRRHSEGPELLPGDTALPELVNPSWEALRLLARHGDYFRKDLVPKYARSCDAVENLASISARKGKDPLEEMRKLEELLERPPF